DGVGFNTLMEQQRDRARAAQKKEVIVAATEGDNTTFYKPTEFIGYDSWNGPQSVRVTGYIFDEASDSSFIILDRSPFYAEMGGQAGDRGQIIVGERIFEVLDTQKDRHGRFL